MIGAVLVTPPAGYHIEIVLSCQYGTTNANVVTIDINGKASCGGNTWWTEETFLPSTRSSYTRLDSIPLEPAQPYDNESSMGLNLYVRNSGGYDGYIRNIMVHGYLVAD